jgi:hypothetical protein
MNKKEGKLMSKMQFKYMVRNKEYKLLKSFESLIKIGKPETADLYADGFGIKKEIRNKSIKRVYSDYLDSIKLISKEELIDNHKISEISEKLRFSENLSKHYAFLNRKN